MGEKGFRYRDLGAGKKVVLIGSNGVLYLSFSVGSDLRKEIET